MKKIILILLVLLCGISLFAEVQEFGVGWQFVCNISSSNYYFFSAIPEYLHANELRVFYQEICTYFSKIKPAGDGYFEVELYQCNGLSDGRYFTFFVKKGDKLDLASAIFNDYPIDSKSYSELELGNLCCIIEDIRPNFIVIDFVKPTE